MNFRKGVTVTGIWLRTIGGQIKVLAEIDGQFRLLIQETVVECDGRLTPISHIIEPSGILASPLDKVTT